MSEDSATSRWQREADAGEGSSQEPASWSPEQGWSVPIGDDPVEPEPENEEQAAARRQHVAEARERSPEAPTGDERSSEWALRFSTGELPAGVSASAGIELRSAGFGSDTLRLEIMDRTTGATGSFVFSGLEISVGYSSPLDPQWSSGEWKAFNTSEMSLNDFNDDFVRHVSWPFNLVETLQFTNTDVKHDTFEDTFMYGDGVDVGDLGKGLPNPEAGYSGGPLLLQDLHWAPTDPWGNFNAHDGTFELNPERRFQPTVFKEALAAGLQEFVDRMNEEAIAQLPPEAVPATAHQFQEILDQQSSPDPVTELQHETAETQAQASLPYPAPLDLTVEETPPMPDDARGEQSQDDLEQQTNLPPDTNPPAAVDHSLREEEAQQTMLPDHEVREGVAQQSLPTGQQLDEQQAIIEQAQAEEQAQQSLPTEQQRGADSAAGVEAVGGPTSPPQGADTTVPPDSPETTPDSSPPNAQSGDAGASESSRGAGDQSLWPGGGGTSLSEGGGDPLAELDQDLAQQDALADQEAQADQAEQTSTADSVAEAEPAVSDADTAESVSEQAPPPDGGGP